MSLAVLISFQDSDSCLCGTPDINGCLSTPDGPLHSECSQAPPPPRPVIPWAAGTLRAGLWQGPVLPEASRQEDDSLLRALFNLSLSPEC